MQKSQSPHRISPSQQHKDSILSDPFTKTVTCISINLDTGYSTIEVTPVNRKTEINPVGHYVHFVASLEVAKRLKQRFDRCPYLVEKYLKSF